AGSLVVLCDGVGEAVGGAPRSARGAAAGRILWRVPADGLRSVVADGFAVAVGEHEQTDHGGEALGRRMLLEDLAEGGGAAAGQDIVDRIGQLRHVDL